MSSTASRTKARITITIDREFLEAAEKAVAEGRAKSVSAWIAEALEPLRRQEDTRDVIDDILRQAGKPPLTEEDLEWGRNALEQAWQDAHSSSTPER